MLAQNHIDELKLTSAIGSDVIKARGYRTVTDRAVLAALGFAGSQQLVPALLVPYFDIYGQNGVYQAKPQNPRADKKTGRPVKYESIANQPPVIDYNPIQPREWLQDKTKRLWIVEGAKKADSHITKLREAGVDEPVLCIIGVWNWGKDDKLDPAFNDIAITGREIVVVPDGDIWSNENIKLACARLKGKLGQKRAASVVITGLPENGKDGLDDLYAAGFTLQELLTLVKTQQQPAIQAAIIDSGNKPTISKLGARFAKQHPDFCFGLGDWRQRKNGYWPVVDEESINSLIHDFLLSVEPEGITYNSYNIREIQHYLKNERFVPAQKWDMHPHLIPLKNGLFDLKTGRLIPHNDSLYFSAGLDFDYDRQATCPLWLNYLDTLRRPAGEVEFLQEFVGYCLTADTSHELTIWLAGMRGAGKSTFVETVGKMLGAMAGSLSLKDIAESRFGLYALVGKRLVFSSENPSVYIKDIELLNRIVSGETMRVEDKFLRGFDYNPFAKVLFAMNKTPQVYQPESGFWRRVKIIKFDRPVANADVTLKEKLLTELPGIFNWAIGGYKRLRQRGRFEIPDSVTSATDDFELKNDILGRFVAECCAEGDFIKRKKFYEAFRLWCTQAGHNVLSLSSVTDRLGEMGYQVGRYQAAQLNIKGAIRGLHLDVEAFAESVNLSEFPGNKNHFVIDDSDHSGGVIKWQ